MRSAGRWIAMLVMVFVAATDTWAQRPDPAEHEQKVRDIVAFLQYVLNTIGSKETSARDKDVLIRESYTKIFRDSKVQVEDDLDEDRSVITNKDVQAYLKDVDFFFEDAAFDFNIRNIQGEVNANGELFYKVTTARNLRGTTVGGKQVNKTVPPLYRDQLQPGRSGSEDRQHLHQCVRRVEGVADLVEPVVL